MLNDFIAFKINFRLEKAVSLVDSFIRSKHWNNFSVANLKLEYVPFWFFSFDAFGEKENKEVSRHVSGKKTFNTKTNELSDSLAELFDSNGETEKVASKEYLAKVVESKILKEEVKEIAGIRIASSLGFAKENVRITGLELFFVPVWVTFVTINEKNFKIEINAVTGEISGGKKVPEREKGFLELIREIIEELKNPGAWTEYFKKAISLVVKKPFLPVSDASFNWKMLLIIIAIIFILTVVFRVF